MSASQFNAAWRPWVVLGTLLGSFPVGAAWAGNIYPVTNLNDSGSGSLRAAITSTNGDPDSTITFQPGLSGTIVLASAEPTITNSLTIQGPSATTLRVDGGQAVRLFSLSSPPTIHPIAVTISNLILQNGSDALDKSGGSAILNNGGNLTVSGCTLGANRAAQGGAVFSAGGTVNLINCTFAYNTATGSGGGVGLGSSAAATVNGCTFVVNSAGSGGAISSSGSTVTLTDDLIYGDTGGEISGSGVSAAYCDIQDSTPANTFTDGGHNINTDPNFGKLQDNGGPTITWTLLPGSPCFGAGIASPSLATDQRGIARPLTGGIEIGSYSKGYLRCSPGICCGRTPTDAPRFGTSPTLARSQPVSSTAPSSAGRLKLSRKDPMAMDVFCGRTPTGEPRFGTSLTLFPRRPPRSTAPSPDGRRRP